MLPSFTQSGDLPPGIHRANWPEIEERFGTGTDRRQHAFAKLRYLHGLASRTGYLARFLIFGSFVSAVEEPRDVDVVLVMAEDFRVEAIPREAQTLFSHADADARFGASVFWLRDGMLPEQLAQMFFDTWQLKRNGQRRGIVEVIS